MRIHTPGTPSPRGGASKLIYRAKVLTTGAALSRGMTIMRFINRPSFRFRFDKATRPVSVLRLELTLPWCAATRRPVQYHKYDSPTDSDDTTAMSFSQSSCRNRVYSLAIGDTALLGANVVNAFRAAVNRGNS
jgi:hypothetical protein